MNLERQTNIEMQEDNFGEYIQYGDQVLLKHVFTDLYLVIEPNLITGSKGMVQINLAELSNKAIMSLIPAQDIKPIASELAIHESGISKFKLHVGGQINLQDSFFLLNLEIGANYYANVDHKEATGKNGKFAELSFNAGQIPTSLRAKLFMAAKDNIL